MIEFIQNEDGQSMVEYALILTLIALAVVGVIGGVGRSIDNAFYDKIIGTFENI